MSTEKDTASLIQKYLENKCHPDELNTIIHLFQQKEHEQQIQDLLFEYWRNTPSFQHKIAREELNQMLDSIHHRINLDETSTKAGRRKIIYFGMRAAAILFIPLLITSLWLLSNKGAYRREQAWITLETPPGSRLKTTLPDGTEVWQNAGTSLQYPAEFTKRNREVILTGEAYFHVSSDLKNPFYVKTADGTIKVTGTKFNVSAFPDDNFSSVVLEEGKVSYTPAGKEEEPIALLPEEQMIYLRNSGSLIKQRTDVEKYTSWTEGKLIFRNDPLSEVIARLQRWYNAEIILSDPNRKLGELTFTLTVKNETLPQVLEYLAQAANLSFETQQAVSETINGPEKKKYILSKNEKNKMPM
ncbi:FecR family protein [Gaoshiqia sp. Z1-71]|uniref:FecR family protein n=1 Tax=Gaoshiqia hydrogeniformans TaxID=3290090 RepID=UPI003BF88DC6